MVKSYFPAPNYDCAPGGFIALGDILSDPKDPEESVNNKPISLQDERVVSEHKKRFITEIKEAKDGGGGFFANVFEHIGLRISGGRTRNTGSFLHSKDLETLRFKPSDEYMQRSLAEPKVQEYLEDEEPKSIYMVTGLKIAHGAEVLDKESSLGTAKFSLGLDGAPMGVPLSLGPEGHWSNGLSLSVSFQKTEPFVFAYQLREIHYRKGVPSSTAYRKDAVYGIGEIKKRDEGGEEANMAVFMSIDDEDVTGDDVDLEYLHVREDLEGADDAEDRSADEEETCELILIR